VTTKYNKVYINEVSTITGPYEKDGPLSKYFDKSYKDLYFGEKTWEQAEVKLIIDSVDMVLNKVNKIKSDIDLHISGDLLNQVTASSYAASVLKIPFLGIYSACASSAEGIIIGANMIEAGQIENVVTSVSSHNNAAEKQFRYPVEYGGPKRKTATFTTTGGAAAYLSKEKKGIKIESSTIGEVIDMGVTDAYNMGAVMAPAAASTIYNHLKDLDRDIDYYDLVLTGDLGKYGKNILKEYMMTEYGIKLTKYEDSATMIFDSENKYIHAGGSGPACIPLVTYSYIFSEMKKGAYKKILYVATGALHSVSMVNQKLAIPAIAHLVSMEVS